MRVLVPSHQTGLTIVAAAFLIAPGMDVIAKLLTQTLSPGQVVLGRFVVQTVLLLPLIALISQWTWPRAGHWLAGGFLAAALLCLNAALQVMPVANALAIFFVEPLILTVLAAWVLKERMDGRRIVAVLVGLAGVLVVLRPNVGAYGPAALLPLGTALFFACYMLVTRVMTLGGKRLALQFWTGIAASAIIGVACLVGTVAGAPSLALTPVDASEAWLFLAMGALAVVTHQMLVLALSMTPASVLAPSQYLEIVSAVLLGWWVFGDFPDPLTRLGALIIIGAGVYVFHRERQLRESGT